MCDCAEMRYENKDGIMVEIKQSGNQYAYHDCEYVRERNKHIELSKVTADWGCKQEDYQDLEEYNATWTKLFLQEMDRRNQQ